VAKAAHTSAQVGLERARRNLGYTEIRAPIDGVVVERAADLGQTVAASTSAPTLFLLAQDLSQMEILASVDEGDIGKISAGQGVRFTVQAYGDEEFSGVVKQVRLQSKTQDNVVSYSVVIGVSNADGRLLPAMTATVEFVVARSDDVLKVANAALRFQPTAALREAALAARAASRDSAAPGGPAARGERTGERTGEQQAGEAGTRPATATARGTGSGSVLWLIDDDGTPSMVRVQTGLTDGQFTEVRGMAVSENMQVIAGTMSSAAGAEAAPNPFQSSQQRAPGGPRF
jgi:HlyD family secretion protein